MTENELVGWYHRLNGHEFLRKLLEIVKDRPGMQQSMGSQIVRQDLVTEQ